MYGMPLLSRKSLYSAGIFSSSGAVKMNVGLKCDIAWSREWVVLPYFRSPTILIVSPSNLPWVCMIV